MEKENFSIFKTGIMGVVVGDALGMPVQFISRDMMKEHPIDAMEGFGTYNMPPGTWSDDSSMTLAALDSICQKKELDLEDIMIRFVKWLIFGEYTPFGAAFDMGNTCVYAIEKYVDTKDVNTCGKTGEWANGNGALMRIMPICLYAYLKQKKGDITEKEALDYVHRVAALTHNHTRSDIACGIYYFMIKAIVENKETLLSKLQKGIDDARRFYQKDLANLVELSYYGRLFYLDEFCKVPESEIRSSGYVVDSLEAAVWSLIATEDFKTGLLKAVNLGGDTDTIGAIAGGLAALHYGYDEIPVEWLETIEKREWIEDLCKQTMEVLC